MDLFTEAGKLMLSWGPPGVVALLAIMALVFERRERKQERSNYDAEIKSKDDKLVETLINWRTDTQLQGERTAGLLEKVATIAEALNKRARP